MLTPSTYFMFVAPVGVSVSYDECAVATRLRIA